MKDTGLVLRLDFQFGVHHGEIHPVVDVVGQHRVLAHPGAPHVALIREDKGRGQGVYREGGLFVVVADGRADEPDLLRGHVPLVQQGKGHDGAAVGVVHPVHGVSDVVQVPGDGRQLAGALRVAQQAQNIPGGVAAALGVGQAVLGKPDGLHAPVALLHIGADLRVGEDVLGGEMRVSHRLILR